MKDIILAACQFMSVLSLLGIVLQGYPVSAIEVMNPRLRAAKSPQGIGQIRVEGRVGAGTATYTRNGHLITAAHNIPQDSSKVFFNYSLDGGRTFREIEIDPARFRVPSEYFEIIDSNLSQEEKISRSNPFDFAVAKLDPFPESEVFSPFRDSADMPRHSRMWEVYGSSTGIVAGTRNLHGHTLQKTTSGHKIIFVPEASDVYFSGGDSGGPLLMDNVDGTYEIIGVVVARKKGSGGLITFFDQRLQKYILNETARSVHQEIDGGKCARAIDVGTARPSSAASIE